MHGGFASLIGLSLAALFTHGAEYRFEPTQGIEGVAINNQDDTLLHSGPYLDDSFLRDRKGNLTSLVWPDGEQIWPLGMNNRGTIVGDVWDPVGHRTIGFIRTKHGGFTSFVSPRCVDGMQVNSINNRGDIVGVDDAGSFIRHADGSYEYIYCNGDWTWIYGINDRGQVSGQCGLGSLLRNADGTFVPIEIAGSQDTQAFGINNRGIVVGSYWTGENAKGFVWSTNGLVETIDFPGARHTLLWDINDSGDVIGIAYGPEGGPYLAFIARPSQRKK